MSYPPGNLASKLCRSCCFWAPLILAAPPPESSLTKSRQPPSCPNKLLVVTDPRANFTSLSQFTERAYLFSPAKQTVLYLTGQGALLTSDVWLAGKLCTCMARLPWVPARGHTWKRPWRDGKGWAGSSWKAVHPGGILWVILAPELRLQPWWETGLVGTGALGACSSVLLKRSPGRLPRGLRCGLSSRLATER